MQATRCCHGENIINGIFDEPSSSFPNQFINVFTSSSVANKDLPDKFMAIAEFEKDPLIAYNTSMFEDSVIINVKENAIIDELITINRINYKTSDGVLVFATLSTQTNSSLENGTSGTFL